MVKKQEKIAKTASIRALDETYTPSVFGTYNDSDYNTLYDIVKRSPEVMACLQAITEDIVADEWDFIGKAKKNLEEADAFAEKVNLYKIISNMVYELLTTGNAYILKLATDQTKMKDLISTITKSMAAELNIEFKKKTEILLQDMTKPQDLQLIKASTVAITYDETGKVSSFVQRVGGRASGEPERVFKAEDVSHTSLINVGGEPYGSTGLETLKSDIATLMFAKDYAGRFFENDGTPNFLFKMPEDNPDSRNFEQLVKELRELKKKNEKFKNMVVTGKVDVEQIQKFNKDMEFAKLIQHFTQLVLIGLGVPTHRINYTLTDSQSGSQVNRAYEGYYKKISFLQRLIENQLNKDLFIPFFKVKIKFKRSYKIDEMREAQIAQILSQIGAVTIEEIRDRIGMDPELPAGTMPGVTGDQNSIDFNADKKREQGQDNNAKRPDSNMDNKLKSYSNEVDVSFPEFVMIVERYTGDGAFNKAKILYRETADEFIIYFNDGSWVYKSVVNKANIDVEAFRFERLGNAIKVKY
jgi:HK97 family phage portal protein